MAFKFDIKSGVPVPEIPRTGGGQPTFPFADMKPNEHFDIPVAFWVQERKMKESELDPKDLRERVQRAFYSWKRGDKSRANMGVVVENIFDKKDDNKLVSTRVFMVAADGSTVVSKKAK